MMVAAVRRNHEQPAPLLRPVVVCERPAIPRPIPEMAKLSEAPPLLIATPHFAVIRPIRFDDGNVAWPAWPLAEKERHSGKIAGDGPIHEIVQLVLEDHSLRLAGGVGVDQPASRGILVQDMAPVRG